MPSRLLRGLVLVLCAFTFLLVLMGGLVHNTHSSLACPDWPLCYGQVFPKMVGGVLVEHSHRLLAGLVLLLTSVLVILLASKSARENDRRWGWLGAIALFCVAFQAVLGGITVMYRLPTIVSTTHLAVSMIFFSILIYLAVALRPQTEPAAHPFSVGRITAWTAIAIYVQMVLGALLRHLGGGLACSDLPLCHGQLWPFAEHPIVRLHMLHRLLALAVLVLVCIAAVHTYRRTSQRSVRLLALSGLLLALLQVGLGVLSVFSLLDVAPVTAHLGVAALLLGDFVLLHLLTRRRQRRSAPLLTSAPGLPA